MQKDSLRDAALHGEDVPATDEPDAFDPGPAPLGEEEHLYVLTLMPSLVRSGPVVEHELTDDEAADMMMQLAQSGLLEIVFPKHSSDCECGEGTA